MLRFTVFLTMALGAVPAWAGARPASAERVIQHDIQVHLPLLPCAAARVVRQIAESVAVPAGVEFEPEACEGDHRRATTGSVSFQWTTIGDAMNALVRLDPRYRWAEDNGVIVMRPLAAWQDRDHFLHRTVSTFRHDDLRAATALAALQTALGFASTGAEAWPARTPAAARRFSVALDETSVLDAFNAVVREHEALVWEITYCQAPALHEHATVWLSTLDGDRRGDHAIFLRDADGRRYNPCAATAGRTSPDG